MNLDILGVISGIETIAIGSSILELPKLCEKWGAGRWRKLKGVATVRLGNGSIREAELHWYEAHGIGKKKIKIKRFLD
ncbi:MAG: hypothetical protein F6J92_01825 [Symploca sp. SIO1A3]|nr:hypothetical protein [Symploca sp. SIO1A3]